MVKKVTFGASLDILRIDERANISEGQQDGVPGFPNGVASRLEKSDAQIRTEPEREKSTENDGTDEGGASVAEGKANVSGGPETKEPAQSEPKTQKEGGDTDESQPVAPEDGEVSEKNGNKSKNGEDSGSKPEEPRSVLDQLSLLKPPETPVFVGDSKNAELVKSLNQAVNCAVSSLAGGKGRGVSPNVNAADLAPQDWDKLFEMTGLYQGYDIDEKYPRRSMEPLFVLAKDLAAKEGGKERGGNVQAKKTAHPQTGAETGGGRNEAEGNVKEGAVEKDAKDRRVNKPTFLPDDKMGVTVETTQTERTRFFLESGFTSADLSVTVPYVAASVKAEQTEKWAKKQATRTVYFTAKAEFPRCRIDIRSSVEQGYLKINPDFVERVKEIWGKLKAREKELCDMGSGVCTLDGEADEDDDDELKKRMRIINAVEGNSAEAVEKAAAQAKQLRQDHVDKREREALEIAKLTDIHGDVTDLLQRFGAVWVEQITLGGQIYRTSKEELTWEESTHEKTESIKCDVKAAAAGGGAGVGAMFGTAEKSGRSDSEAGNQVSHQAIGGDTLLYNADDPNEWLDSVKNPHHWRAIRYKGIKKLCELPGLREVQCTVTVGKNGFQMSRSLYEMLSDLLKIAERSTKYAVKRAKVPRRSLGEAWIKDLEGCWYGCYTWHKSLTQIPGAVVLTMEIERPEVERFTAATSGVESAYLHQLEIKGTGHDDKGKFTIKGNIVELENKLRRCKDTPYEILGVVEMRKQYVKSSRGATWHGASSLKYAAKRLDADDPPPIAGGCFTRFCKPGCRNVHTHGVEVTDQSKDSPADRETDSESKEDDEWLYRGHLDRLGMHGYWSYKGPTVAAALPDANHQEPEFAQEGGTWTVAPVDELPQIDDLYVIQIRPPLPYLPKLPVHLTDLGRELKELMKLEPADSLYVTSSMRDGLKVPFPDNKTLKEVLKGPKFNEVLSDAQLENPSEHVRLTYEKAGDAPDPMNSARITRKGGRVPQKLALQSVESALETLQRLPGFGKGRLETKYGITLAPGTLLEARTDYVFVPENAGDQGIVRPPQDPWNFVEREAAISEPRRRWILPPDAHVESSDGLQSERPLSIDRFMGMWQGYVVEDLHPGRIPEHPHPESVRPVAALESHTRADRRTKREIRKEFTDGGRKKGRSGQVLPPPVWTNITTCDLVGGSVGHAKYLVKGKTWRAIRRVPKWLAPSFRLEGTLTQVPVARPNEEDAKHSYPILAKVEAIGTPVFLSVRIPFMRKRFYKGHLDHMGMHGFTGRVGVPELRGTFGLMPVQPDVDGRRKVEHAKEEARRELERRERSAGRRCWQFRRRLKEDEAIE